MVIASEQNLTPRDARDRRFGIRITMPPSDTFRNILGDDWIAYRWYATEAERDAALRDMLDVHRYSRRGDAPSIVCEQVERDATAGPPSAASGQAETHFLVNDSR